MRSHRHRFREREGLDEDPRRLLRIVEFGAENNHPLPELFEQLGDLFGDSGRAVIHCYDSTVVRAARGCRVNGAAIPSGSSAKPTSKILG